MKYRYQSGETVFEVVLERTGAAAGNRYRVTINEESYNLEVLDSQPGSLALRFGTAGGSGDAVDQVVRPTVVYWGAEGDTKWLSAGGCTYKLDRPKERPRSRVGGGVAPEDILRAPMPAQVRAVQVAEGDAVEAGQTLLLLEAMKMEIKLASPRAATVCRLLAKQGETVEKDQVLVELE